MGQKCPVLCKKSRTSLRSKTLIPEENPLTFGGMKRLKRFALGVVVAVGLFSGSRVGAQNINVNNTPPKNNPQWLAQNVLVGPQFTLLPQAMNLVNSAFINQSSSVQIGKFYYTAHNANFGLDSGIVMVTGGANDVVPGQTGAAGVGASLSANLLTVLTTIVPPGSSTNLNDKASIAFTFIAPGDSIKFDYIFSSNEYASYTCTQYNDVFGFFLIGKGINANGPNTWDTVNLARIPGTTVPVAVNTINGGSPTGGGSAATCLAANPNYVTHSMYFNSNTTAAGINPSYTGFTDVFTAKARVRCGFPYTIKMQIADVADGALNSAVFIGARSFVLPTITLTPATNTGNTFADTNIVEGCKPSALIIQRAGATTDTMTIGFLLSPTSTATSGLDYNTLPASVTLLPGVISDTVYIQAIDDGVVESIETIKLIMQPVSTFCADYPSQTVTFRIRDKVSASMTASIAPLSNDTITCPGEQVTLIGSFTNGEGTTRAWWGTDTTSGNQIVVSPNATTTYYYNVLDECMSLAAMDSVTVYRAPYDSIQTQPVTKVICPGGDVWIAHSGSKGKAPLSVLWETGPTTDSIHVYPSFSRYYSYTLTDACGVTKSDSVYVKVMPIPTATFAANIDGVNPLKVRFMNTSSPHVRFAWYFGDGDTNTVDSVATHIYAIPGTYPVSLRITDSLGCTDSIQLDITVQMDYYFYIPTGFTPNNDRLNDAFVVKGMGILDFEMEVFNRWGLRVFYSNDMSQSWDGNINGVSAPEDTYTYRVFLQLPLGKVHEEWGSVTLYR